MNYEYIKEFVVLAQHTSFKAAAKTLFVSQPTLSAHLTALEEEIGCKLVERQPPLSLTAAGRYFLDNAVGLVEDTDRRIEALTSKTLFLSTHLYELAIPDFTRIIPLYAELILRAKEKYERLKQPDVLEIKSIPIFESGNFNQTASLEEVFNEEAIDWMIYISGASRSNDEVTQELQSLRLECLKISSCECKLVVSVKHPLLEKQRVMLSGLADYPFYCNRYPASYYQSYQQAIADELSSHGLTLPIEQATQKHNALNSWGGGEDFGDGIAPTPELAFSFLGFFDQNRNAVLNVEDFTLRFDFYLVYPQNTGKSHVLEFINFIREAKEELENNRVD